MSIENVITSIDIWSSKIRTVIWYYDDESNNNMQVLGVWISDSNAIRKWNILDMEEFKNNLDKSLEEAERMSWEQVSWAFISFNSSSFEVVDNKWIIAISWEEIDYDDVDRVLDMARNGVQLPNREILKVIPDSFWVDFEEWVKSPVWMSARKLEVRANIFSVSNNILNNIKKAIEDVWIEVYDVFPNLITSPEWVLTKRQKELGVVCIDIWASTTWVTLYEEWVLKFSTLIPIWWDSVTSDIALWLRTSIDVAEKIKKEHWELNLSDVENYRDELIDLTKISPNEDQDDVSKIFLSKIITARYEEILYFIKEELKKVWKDWMLPEWAVFVWGGSKIKWFTELAKETLRLPVSIGIPVENEMVADTSMSDPSFSWVLWTIIIANKYRDARSKIVFNFSSLFWSIVKVIKKILP